MILGLQVRAFDVTLGDSFLYLIYSAVVIGGFGRPSCAPRASSAAAAIHHSGRDRRAR